MPIPISITLLLNRDKKLPSTAYNTLLAVAQQLKLWTTPSRQTYAELPGVNQKIVAVPLWSEEFFTWCYARFNFQNFPAPITYNKVLRTLDESAQSQPRETIQPANPRTATTADGYQIDLGGATIQLTGKQWTILAPDDHRGFRFQRLFQRPAASRPLPSTTHSGKDLPSHLRAAFGLDATNSPQVDPAKALSQWLELALGPDMNCPPLILTGEFRDEAAEAIRQLIDPASCAMLPFPTSRNEAGWMAIYNRVLAFQILGTITEFKQTIMRELAQGLLNARLRQSDHKGPKRYQQLGRPVIITAEEAPEIRGNQIVIEIKRCEQLPQQEVLAALFNQMVRSLRDEPKSKPEPKFVESAVLHQTCITLEADVPGP